MSSYQEKLAELRALRHGKAPKDDSVRGRMVELRAQRQGGGAKAEPAPTVEIDAPSVVVWAGPDDGEVGDHVAALVKGGAVRARMVRDVAKAGRVVVVLAQGVSDARDPKAKAEIERLKREGTQVAVEVHLRCPAPFAPLVELADGGVTYHMPESET